MTDHTNYCLQRTQSTDHHPHICGLQQHHTGNHVCIDGFTWTNTQPLEHA